MLQDDQNFDVEASFEERFAAASQLWDRIGEVPDFKGKDVLEIGSGLGTLTAWMGLQGARSVVGLDTWAARVDYAGRNLAARFPDLKTVRFDATPIERIPGENLFDIVASENTFEHVSDVDVILGAIRRLLRPGGCAYIGFAPLYHSPFGDHGELRAKPTLPWGHLFAGEAKVIEAFNKANNETVTTLMACGYNALKPAEFVAAFERSGLEIEIFRRNRTEGGVKQAMMDAFLLLAKVPALEPYFTVGMYLKLRKRASA